MTVRYRWRLLRDVGDDYFAFVHLKGVERGLNHDHRLGGDYGTSEWAPGEVVEETLTLSVPPDTPPGSYRVTVGVWLPSSGRRLHVSESDLPSSSRYAVKVGTLAVTR